MLILLKLQKSYCFEVKKNTNEKQSDFPKELQTLQKLSFLLWKITH